VLNLSALILIIPLIAGILLGYFSREKTRLNLDKVTLIAIVVLIFSLGFSIGSNTELLNSMPKIGLTALVMSILAIIFSVVFVKLARRKVRME
jgi:uncharacterized membrane protein YbjE (DUF340 family)